MIDILIIMIMIHGRNHHVLLLLAELLPHHDIHCHLHDHHLQYCLHGSLFAISSKYGMTLSEVEVEVVPEELWREEERRRRSGSPRRR